MSTEADLGEISAVVTGGNSGIGLATARRLAERGAHVIIGCRSRAAGSSAVAAIRLCCPDAHVENRVLDLTDAETVREFARSVDRKVDVLINNAGAAFRKTAMCDDGLELTYSTNLIGHVRLTAALLPQLIASRAGRVVWVASGAYQLASVSPIDLDRPWRHGSGWTHYSAAKLGVVLVAQRFDEEFRARAVCARSIAVNPGVAGSRFLANSGAFGPGRLGAVIRAQSAMFMPDPVYAAEPIIAAVDMVDPAPGRLVERAQLGGLRGTPVAHRTSLGSDRVAMGPPLWDRLIEICGPLSFAEGGSPR